MFQHRPQRTPQEETHCNLNASLALCLLWEVGDNWQLRVTGSRLACLHKKCPYGRRVAVSRRGCSNRSSAASGLEATSVAAWSAASARPSAPQMAMLSRAR